MDDTKSDNTIAVKKLQVRTVEAVRSRYGLFGLCFISYIESALVVPLITDPFLVGYILANKRHVVRGVVGTTISSILGGLTAYIFAVGFFELSLNFLSTDSVELLYEYANRFEDGAFILTILGAVTPIPYTLVALAAGFVKSNLLLFILATLLGRGFRYILVGYVTYKFGDRSLQIIRKNLALSSLVLFIFVAIYIFVHYYENWI